MLIDVEIPHEDDKHDQHRDKSTGTKQPPRPPERLTAFEEADWPAGETANASFLVGEGIATRVDGAIRRFIGAHALSQQVRGMQDADAEDEAHEEAADMAEVVERREQA